MAEAVIGALIAFDRISNHSNSPFQEAIYELRDKGILKTAIARSRNYTVTEQYRAALDQLRVMCA